MEYTTGLEDTIMLVVITIVLIFLGLWAIMEMLSSAVDKEEAKLPPEDNTVKSEEERKAIVQNMRDNAKRLVSLEELKELNSNLPKRNEVVVIRDFEKMWMNFSPKVRRLFDILDYMKEPEYTNLYIFKDSLNKDKDTILVELETFTNKSYMLDSFVGNLREETGEIVTMLPQYIHFIEKYTGEYKRNFNFI